MGVPDGKGTANRASHSHAGRSARSLGRASTADRGGAPLWPVVRPDKYRHMVFLGRHLCAHPRHGLGCDHRARDSYRGYGFPEHAGRRRDIPRPAFRHRLDDHVRRGSRGQAGNHECERTVALQSGGCLRDKIAAPPSVGTGAFRHDAQRRKRETTPWPVTRIGHPDLLRDSCCTRREAGATGWPHSGLRSPTGMRPF